MTSPSLSKESERHETENAPQANGASGRRGRLVLMLISAASGALVALVAVAVFLKFTGGQNYAALPIIGKAPAYRLIDQNGKSVSSTAFAGKVQIVTAVFPYCTELCPLIAANLADFHDRVVQRTGLKGHVVFVFFNVAPDVAGPPQLRQFLKQYGFNPGDPSVFFLTGPRQEIRRVVRNGYHIAYYRTKADSDDSGIEIKNPLAEKAKLDFDIKHDDTIELVDGAGRIRKIFENGTRVGNMRLERAIAPLVTDGASTNRASR